ncbi:hypothetical protein CEXT_102651 [Caerostris extrusa]|uniref:Uncharacterized protein n=1 Tax=Caerostris extrusa TaxID=172846 RepID=A0AAV4TUF2_CAEEX|nr:hypothetical protein CEXT_102651 [Caerostris extrusa]
MASNAGGIHNKWEDSVLKCCFVKSPGHQVIGLVYFTESKPTFSSKKPEELRYSATLDVLSPILSPS